MHEIIGIKIATLIPAVSGGVVYAMRIGDQSWAGRFTGGFAGVLSAMYVGPAAGAYLGFPPEAPISSGIIFLVGVTAAVALKPIWGILSDPHKFREFIVGRRKK